MSAAGEPDPPILLPGGAAVITGFAAAELPRLVRRYAWEALGDYPPQVRGLLEDALHALDAAADLWRASAARGTAEPPPAEPPLRCHRHEDDVDTGEVAELLGITPRGVRKLAATGALAGRKSADRWSFNRAVVTAFCEGRQHE